MQTFRARPLLLVLIVLVGAGLLASARQSEAGSGQTFLVVYKASSVPADAPSTISRAGGAVVYTYPQIGVAVAASANPAFGINLQTADNRVLGAVATTAFRVSMHEGSALRIQPGFTAPVPLPPAPGGDSLSGLQWDMDQIQAPEAHAITDGSPSVIVGVLDSGIDYTHPDLAPNIDFADAVSCVGGAPNQAPDAWADTLGHGTMTAGIIAAAQNGLGIVGVAPKVKIAPVRVASEDFLIYPEAVVCGFMWAASHRFAVTNNSYFADPWYFNCRNDETQRAIWEAERRAIRYAIQQGVVVVAVLGNYSDDLAHPTQDVVSPDNSTPEARTIHNNCAVVPAEVPGVIGVAANGNLRMKSYYSNYGVGVTQVIAPGGDDLQVTETALNGMVLSTWPGYPVVGDFFGLPKVTDAGANYAYWEGTSFAAPHVAGVAALLASRGFNSPGAVAAQLLNTADAMPCPSDMSFYAPFPSVSNGAPQVCQEGSGCNGFNGRGQVNALRAVAKGTR